MNITLDNRSAEEFFGEQCSALAEFVLRSEAAHEDTELSLSLVSKAEMRALNKKYRAIDAPTDVLSFENDGDLIGDVIICPEIARVHADDFDSTFSSEMELMLTHGILHLLGYDHEEDEAGDAMEARENELLAAWRAR